MIKIGTLNVRGLREESKRKQIFQFLKNKRLDFYLIQETHSTPEIEQKWTNEWGSEIYYSNHSSSSRGTMILCSPSTLVQNETKDQHGRLVIITIKSNDKIIAIVNVYAPNDENEQILFFNSLNFKLSNDIPHDEIIIGGDFNIHLENIDKRGGKTVNKKSKPAIKDLIENLNLIDIWRKKHPTQKQFTWEQPTKNIRTRLDYFLISKSTCKDVKECNITESLLSDHKLVYIEFKKLADSKKQRGPGFWKFNSSLLLDKTYCSQIEIVIEDSWTKNQEITDIRAKWDFLKYNIQTFTMGYSKKKAKTRRQLETTIITRLDELHKKHGEDTLNTAEQTEQNSLRDQLEKIHEYKAEGSKIRSRIEIIEQGEKSNKFFYNQEIRSYDKKTITKLTTENGIIIENQQDILKEINIFYKKLFSSTIKEDADFSELENLSSLPQNDQEAQKSCDRKIRLLDLGVSLNLMKNGKSPGCDGLTVEFYKHFWSNLGTKLLETLIYADEKGELSQSQKRGVITLLHKQGKDQLFIKNWRPVTLLNIDYKILSKTLAQRVKEVIQSLIHPDQRGFIKGRYIGENIRQIDDLMHIAEQKKKTGLLLLVDFEKAFDSIEWKFIDKVLEKFCFGPYVRKLVQLCYTQVSSTVINNGYSSGWFSIKRGVRQGCPLSSLLFLLCIEILAELIRGNQKVKGFKIGKSQFKLSLFADDASCIVEDLDSLTLLLKILEKFYNYSGLKINLEKCLLVYIGPWKTKEKKVQGIITAGKSFNMLGIQLGSDNKICDKLNFENKISSMNVRLRIWASRNLTLIGKILIAKSMGMSNLIYSISCKDCSTTNIKVAQGHINKFIWNGKPAKIKHTTLIAEKDDWGLKAPDLLTMQKGLRLAWLARLINNNAHMIVEDLLDNYGGLKLLLNCDYDPKLLELPVFYKNIFEYFKELGGNINKKTILWNNTNIKINNKLLYIKEWRQNGLLYVSQLIENNKVICVDRLKLKFSLRSVNLLVYNAIKLQIHKLLKEETSKNNIFDNNNIDFDTNIFKLQNEYLNVGLAKCKDYYKLIIKSKIEPASSHKYWEKAKITNSPVYQNSMTLACMSCKESSLLAFHFKMIHNILPTGENLKKWGIKRSDLCPKCGECETMVHLLFKCQDTKQTLKCIMDIIKCQPLNDEMQNLNTFVFGTQNQQINYLFLFIKIYIYEMRKNEKIFDETHFKKEIALRIFADETSLPGHKFIMKWGNLKHLQDNSYDNIL